MLSNVRLIMSAAWSPDMLQPPCLFQSSHIGLLHAIVEFEV